MLGVFPKIQKFAKIRRASAVLKLSKKRYFFAERLLRPAAFQVFEHDLVSSLNYRQTDVLLGFWLRFRFRLRLFSRRFMFRLRKGISLNKPVKLDANKILQRRAFAAQDFEGAIPQPCGDVRDYLARQRSVHVFHLVEVCGRIWAAT